MDVERRELLGRQWREAGIGKRRRMGVLGYVDDERVAQLMANGIGHPGTSALIRERCSWIEVDPALN